MAGVTPQNHNLLKFTFLILTIGLALGVALTGCVDRISTLGAQYYSDTIGTVTSVRSDPGFIQFYDTVRPFVTTSPDGINSLNGIDYALTDSTTLMMIGRVNTPYVGSGDMMEAWALLQFPSISQDTVNMITGVKLLLKDGNCSYGDTVTSLGTTVSFNVFGFYSGNQDYDTVSTLPWSTISASVPLGSIDTIFPDSTDRILSILLPPSTWKENLSAAYFNFVVAPMEGSHAMTNVRGFGTMHSYGDESSVPQLEYYLSDGDSVFATPLIDLFYVHELSAPLTNEFTLRGGSGQRERINLNLTRPTDTAHLNAFTTINNATLVLHIDKANSSHSNVESDTIGPDIVQLGAVDSGGHFDGNGYLDLTDPKYDTWRFQVRGLVQNWLSDTATNFGFELRSGYSSRSFYEPAPYSIGVEDYTVNRWTFYGPGAADSLRPYFILSYSKLK